MTYPRWLEIFVGFFMMVGLAALLLLALKVSGLTSYTSQGYYVTAIFDNIGDLKPRAPVTISGVHIGQVVSIELDPKTYQADVKLLIDHKYTDIPVDSTAKIFTQGLLGSNYISIDPGFENIFLKNGDKLVSTRSALILENLIGQLLFKVSGGDQNKSNPEKSTST